MPNEAVILCGGLKIPQDLKKPDMKEFRLSLYGPERNVTLKIQELTQKMVKNISDELIDLLEIATYVFCADQSIPRTDHPEKMGELWHRVLNFMIPVRCPEIWNDKSLKNILEETLGFLSDDTYKFRFEKIKKPEPIQTYIYFSDSLDIDPIDEVVLFSGGIDSLGGVVKECFIDRKKIVLVSHRSANKIYSSQKGLVEKIQKELPDNLKPKYIPVTIHKNFKPKCTLQRGRSFLYASLGMVVAIGYKLNRIRFYENGIVSINLPISEQVVGSRATRTTHPKTIKGFSEIFEKLLKKPFKVENEFFWKTKVDVFRLIKDAGKELLLKDTRSCFDVHNQSKCFTHCGVCSQCIERRFAGITAGCQKYDPTKHYMKDILKDELAEGPERTMVESYFRRSIEISGMNDDELISTNGELFRALHSLEGNFEDNAKHLCALLRRHGKEICDAVSWGIRHYADELTHRQLPETNLLRLIAGSSPPSTQVTLTPQQVADYAQYEYKCRDVICIPGNIPKRRSNQIMVNDHKIKIPDYLFIPFLRLVQELKIGHGGWVNIYDLVEDGILRDEGDYQRFDNLRTELRGSLLDNGEKEFIENDGSKRYRISTHPDFITYDKEKLLNHVLPGIQEIAKKLP